MISRFFLLLLLAATAAGALDIAFDLRQSGQLSLAVYDAQGLLLRELLRGERRAAGRHTVAWDGLDRYGRPAAPGDLEWRLICTPGFRAEFLLLAGTNPKSAPSDLWVGNHAGPTAVLVDPHGALYVGSSCSENAPVLLKQSLDGTRVAWTATDRKPNGTPSFGADALAWAGDRLVQFSLNRQVRLFDPASGSSLNVHDVPWPGTDVLTRKEFAEGVDPAGMTLAEQRANRIRIQPFDAHLAANARVFAISERARHAIRWFDLESGREIGRAQLPEPLGLAMTENGDLYAISAGRVMQFAPQRYENPREVLPAGRLRQPVRLAVDSSDGSLLIVHGEPRPNQVARCAAADGRMIRVFGRPGGRGFGPYTAADFSNILSIADDRRGGFLVTESGEETFRRTAHFSADGKLVNEWYGGQPWGSFVAFDPQKSERLLINGGSEVKALVEADFSGRRYRVTHLLRAPDTGDLFPSLTGHGSLWHLRRQGNALLLVNPGGNTAASAPAVYRADLEKGELIPVARSGNVPSNSFDWRANRLAATAPAFWQAALARDNVTLTRQTVDRYRGFSWSDDNGNDRIDPAEVVLGPAFGYSALFIDADWNLLLAGSPGNPAAPFVFTIRNANPPGAAPRWRWSDAEPLPFRAPAEWAGLGHSGSQGVSRGEDGSLYVFAKGHAHPADDRQGETWPANTSGAVRLMKWNAAGKLAWSVGRHASTNDSAAGEFHDPMRVLGEYRGNVVVQDRVIRIAQVFTTDGLYAGDFFDRHVADALPPEIYTAAPKAHQPGILLHDNIAGVMHVTPAGEVLWNPSGRSGAPIYRIQGWDGWERQSGRFTLPQAVSAAARQGTGLTGCHFANRDWSGEPVLRRVDAELWFGNRTLAATRDLSGRPWLPAKTPAPFAAAGFSVRWQGQVEAPFSEEFRFVIESEYGSQARLRLAGREILVRTPPAGKPAPALAGRTERVSSQPVRLTAGRRYPLEIEYAGGGPAPQLHLAWESFSQERQHVPTALLYPPDAQNESD